MGSSRKKFYRASGAQIGKRSVKVYICGGCNQMVQPGSKKPPACAKCGRMDFETFDSIGECGRWHLLRMQEQAKDPKQRVTNLRRQVRFPLYAARMIEGRISQVKVGEYWADAVYDQNGETVIEDFKGDAITDLADWKLRHMAAQGQPVKITTG